MDPNFDRESKAHPGTVPAVASVRWNTGSMADAHESIAAIWQTEVDRLLKQAYRRLHKTDGVDIEGIVSDALVRVLEAWETVQSVEHCRTLLRKATYQLCIDAIRTSHTEALGDTPVMDPRSKSATTPAQDTLTAWVLDQCADETERRLIAIWMLPGNETFEAVSEATAHWVDRWSVKDVKALFGRLRQRMGVKLASLRAVRFQTIGTLPGLHCERFSTLGCVLLIAMGGRRETATERSASRHVVPAMRLTDTGQWVPGTETVWSTR